MNKSCLYVLVVLCALSLAEAARKKAFYFNLYNELQGSWILMQSKVSISSGDLIGLSEQRMFNVTKSDIPSELVLAEIDLPTREEKRKPYQLLVSASDNFTADVNLFEPGADEEVKKQLSIKFDQFIKDELFYTSGYLERIPNAYYELSLLPGKMIKFQVDLKDSDERVILMGKKIVVAKPKTFFQKYGTYFAVGLAMVVQLITTRMNQNAYGF